MATDLMIEAQSLEYLNKPCGTCHHRRGVHFKTYDGSHAGCIAETGRDHPIICPCAGYMTTESEELQMEYLAEVGRQVFRKVVARQDAEHGPLYRKAVFRCPHGHSGCCGHHDQEDMPIHAQQCPY